MSKNVVYRYNPDTDNYERLYPSLKSRLRLVLVCLGVGLMFGIIFFLIVFYVFDSPTEKNLRKENSQLRSQYKLLKLRLDNSMDVMEQIRQRDDNFYRVMMQMEPLTRSQVYAGLDNEERYKHLQGLSESKLFSELTRNLDRLDRLLYAQSHSFDELKNAALLQKDRLAHVPSILPIDLDNYTIASGFGNRLDPIYGTTAFHAGLDFAASEGDPVVATADGVVVETGWRGGYGNCIEIDHGYNYRTLYGHLSSIDVKPAERVRRGETIGKVGSTGKSTGPHLHYEVRFKDEPQNPVNYYFFDITPEQYDQMRRIADNAGHVMD